MNVSEIVAGILRSRERLVSEGWGLPPWLDSVVWYTGVLGGLFLWMALLVVLVSFGVKA